MAQTAPPGYRDNFAAFLDLIRFGYGIWSQSQMTALLFHAERTTAFGKATDTHSQDQATEGIYSTEELSWVRGPSGLQKSTWHKVNKELSIDPDHPEKTPHGVLRKILRYDRFGKARPTEYTILWPAIIREIDAWKRHATAQKSLLSEDFDSPFFGEPKGEGTGKQGEETGKPLSVFRRPTLRETESQIPANGESTTTDCAPTPLDPGVTLRETERQSNLTRPTTPLPCRSVGRPAAAREMVNPTALAIEAAIIEGTGERPTDLLTSTILTNANRFHMPPAAIARWIKEKCESVIRRNYPLKAGLLLDASNTELYTWCRQNSEYISDLKRRQELAARAPAEVRSMAAAAAALTAAAAEIEQLDSQMPAKPPPNCSFCRDSGMIGNDGCGACSKGLSIRRKA